MIVVFLSTGINLCDCIEFCNKSMKERIYTENNLTKILLAGLIRLILSIPFSYHFITSRSWVKKRINITSKIKRKEKYDILFSKVL